MKKIMFVVNRDIVIYNFRLEIVEALLARNYEVHISSPNGEKIRPLEALGCIFHPLSIHQRGVNPIEERKLYKHYNELLKNINPDIVLTFTIKPNLYVGKLCKTLKIPYITNITGLGSMFSEDSNPIIRSILILLLKDALSESECVFFQNSKNQEYFLNRGFKLKHSVLLPGSGVNTERFPYLEYESKDFLNIYYFGRVMRDKGIYEYLKAAKYISDNYKNVKFHIVGFSEEDDLLKLVNEYHEKGIINYHGYQNDITPYLKQAAAVILPSYHEGMSNSLLEASSSGRPILASDIPGCQEIIDDGKTGYLFKVKNTDSLISKIETFLNLPYERREQMGKEGRKKMINEFSRKIVVEEYLKEISKIVG